MRRKSFFVMIIIMLGAIPAFVARPAAAESMTWTMSSKYDYRVDLSFYSRQANRVWPGNGQVYVLADSRPHAFTIACRPGEEICYGAWPSGGNSTLHWGVGRASAFGCRNCCFVCGESNPTRELE
jgi:hypothetical protein